MDPSEHSAVFRGFNPRFALAHLCVLCLISLEQVQREPTLGGSMAPVGRGLAGLLAILLLLATTFSANHSLHRLLHQDGTSTHLCLACSMVNGQLDLTEAGLITALFIFGLMIGLRLVGTPYLPHIDYRLSPSRAPPYH